MSDLVTDARAAWGTLTEAIGEAEVNRLALLCTRFVSPLADEVERLRAMGLALLEEWRTDELRINGEWGDARKLDPQTEAEYLERKAAWEANRSPPAPPAG